jgi:ABC-type sugar transport system permease subunit
MSIGVFAIVWGLALVFFKYSPGRAGGPILGLGGSNPYIGLEHFVNMIKGTSQEARLFRISLKNTLVFALLALPLNLAITLPLAALIESVKSRLKSFFRAVYFLPVITSAVGVAIMWGWMYDPQAGLLNAIIRLLGGKPIAWLSDPRATFLGVSVAMWACILTRLWNDYGYNMVIIIAALQNIPQEFREAAMLDGAGTWQSFWSVTIPLLRPTLLFVCVMTVLDAFQVFALFDVMTGGGPNHQTRVLMLDIYQNAFRYQRMGWAAAGGIMLTAIVMAITAIQMRALRTEWEY